MKRQVLFLSILLLLFLNSEQSFSQFVTTGTANTNNLFTGGSVSIGTTTAPVFGTNKFIVTGNSLFSGDVVTTSSFGTAPNLNLVFKRGNVFSGIVTEYSTFFGYNSYNSSSINNTVFGANNLISGQVGQNNIVLGNNNLSSTTASTNNNIAIGNSIMVNNTGGDNLAVGHNSLNSNATGFYNTAVGHRSLQKNVSGQANVSIGLSSNEKSVSSNFNTSVGYQSLGELITGDLNTAIGDRAFRVLTLGYRNTGIGQNAGNALTSGYDNVFIGYNTQPNISTTGSSQLNIANKIYGSGTGANSAIGIGVPIPQARLHTLGTVRLEGLPSASTLPNKILGTDNLGNVYNFDPSLLDASNGDNIYNVNGDLISDRFVNNGIYNLKFGDFERFVDINPNKFVNDQKSLLLVSSHGIDKNPNLNSVGQFAIGAPKIGNFLTQGVNFTQSWIQSSKTPNPVNESIVKDNLPFAINPLGGNVGIGVSDATAQLHTIKSVRFEGLPYQEKPNALLGTDADGNVYNFDPSLLGGSNGDNIYNVNGNLTDNRYLNLENKTLGFYGNNFAQVYDTNINPVLCPTGTSGESFSTINGYQSDVMVMGQPSIFMKPNYNNGYFKLKANQSNRAGTNGNQLNFGLGTNNSWMQSSTHYASSRDGYCGNGNSNLHLNPLGGNVGIGVSNATAQLHTTKSVRFEGLPFNANKPIGVLGTDLDGNVFNFDPSTFGTGGASADAWLLNGNSGTNPGTGSGENFLGTIDEKDLVFGVNANEKIRIKPSGRIQLFGWAPSNGANSAYNMYIGGGNDNPVLPTSNTSNLAIGVGSMIQNTMGKYNSSIGFSALENNSTGDANTSFGFQSMRMNTTGHSNLSIGVNSMFNNTTGEYNVALGNISLLNNTTGNGNVGVGAGSLRENTTGHSNAAIGGDALRETNGTYNVAIGVGALSELGSTSIGDGGANVALGSFAGKDLINGDRNIFIGYDVQGPVANNVSNQLNIGNWIFGKNGQIAIGNFTDLPQSFLTNNDYQLIVKKGIRTEKVRVDIASVKNWADYVFEKDYKLMPLNEVKKFIDVNGHLPNIPSSEEVVKDGIDLGEMDAKLLEKIEELTLYTIELNTKNQELQKTKLEQDKLIQNLADRLEKLEKKDKQ